MISLTSRAVSWLQELLTRSASESEEPNVQPDVRPQIPDYRTFPNKISKWIAQYEAIRGRSWFPATRGRRSYVGVLPPPMLTQFAQAIVDPAVILSAGGGAEPKVQRLRSNESTSRVWRRARGRSRAC
jgi:hypothetical protein